MLKYCTMYGRKDKIDSVMVLPDHSLKKLKKLGKGGYGSVCSVVDVSDPTKKAAIKRNLVGPETTFIGSLKELDLLARLNHPFIVELYSVSFGNPFAGEGFKTSKRPNTRTDGLYFIFEQGIYDGHSLIYGGSASFDYLKTAMSQMLLGTECMHIKGIVHRDFKPSNLIWFRDGSDGSDGSDRTIKICDFGLSKIITNQSPNSPRISTPHYRSPESCGGCLDYTTKTDIWSIGCIMFEMVTKKVYLECDDNDTDEIIFNRLIRQLHKRPDDRTIKRINYENDNIFRDSLLASRYPLEHKLSLSQQEINNINYSSASNYTQFVDLLSKCLEFDPDKRLSATDLLNHKFFDSHRKYITDVRTLYPPIPDPELTTVIINNKDRINTSTYIYAITSYQHAYGWYSHRTLFLCISIIDRCLEYYSNNMSMCGTTSKYTSENTSLFENEFQLNLHIGVCLYIAIKYYHGMAFSCPYIEVVNDEYTTPENMEAARKLEIFIVEHILCFAIYQETILEAMDKFKVILHDQEIITLLNYYTKLPTGTKLTSRQLAESFIRKYPSLYRDSTLSKVNSRVLVDNYNTKQIPNTRVVTRANHPKPIISRGHMPDDIKIVKNIAAKSPLRVNPQQRYVPTRHNVNLHNTNNTNRMRTVQIGHLTRNINFRATGHKIH